MNHNGRQLRGTRSMKESTKEPSVASDENKIFCDYCPGFCCYKLSGAYLFVDATDINRIARHFNMTDGEVRQKYMDGKNTFKNRGDGACIFLIDKKICKRCSIHNVSPKQCRDFPYDDPCPYLHREDLLNEIHPRVENSLKGFR